MGIRKKDIVITRTYRVDCLPCGIGVSTDQREMTREEAEEAREEHLEMHRREEL